MSETNQNTSLTQAINDMRTMRESYDILASGVVTSSILSELESGKAAIVAAINAMGGTATENMSMGELAQAIRALIIVQLGELEYNIQIENAEEAINLASTHCTKYVNDYTTQMYTPLIVDEWQAVEEVRYKKLLNYSFDLFSSDERKTGVYALTNCHELKRVTFDKLKSIYISTQGNIFIGNDVQLEQIEAEELESISIATRYDEIITNLDSLEELRIPKLYKLSVSDYSSFINNLPSLKRILLPALTTIDIRAGANFLNNCQNVEYVEFGHIGNDGGSITTNIFTHLNPTNVYEDATKLADLNASIRDHWFANLHDYTGGTAHTLKLMSAFVQHMEEATIQVATDKNWTIVTF